MNADKFKEIIKSKGYNINSLSKAIGMSHVGLSQGIEKGSIGLKHLENISKVLGIKIIIQHDGDMQESPIDRVKIALCPTCNGIILISAFPDCEYKQDIVSAFGELVSTGCQIDIIPNPANIKWCRCNNYKPIS